MTLNSQCAHPAADNPYKNDCAAGSPQEQWLRADLAAHPARCTLAAWHHPWFSSGLEGFNDAVQPLFQALYDNGVDVLLTGHDHGYERFAPMDARRRTATARAACASSWSARAARTRSSAASPSPTARSA